MVEEGTSTLDLNFDDIPDEILPISKGIYGARIVGTPKVEDRESQRTGKSWQQLSVSMIITDDGEEKDKPVYAQMGVGNRKGQVLIKRMAKSAGLEVSNDNPLDLAELEDKDVIIDVRVRSYKDSDDETQVVNSVRDFLTERKGEAGGVDDDDTMPDE